MNRLFYFITPFAATSLFMTGCKDAATDLQIRVTSLQQELAVANRETEHTQKELVRVQEEAKTRVDAANPQTAVNNVSANVGVSRLELDEALQAAFTRFKSELSSIPSQVITVPSQTLPDAAPVAPRPVVGGPSIPAAESRAVDWGDKSPTLVRPNTSPIQRAPVVKQPQPPPQSPPRQSTNLPPAAQEVPIKF